jgi:hypothetical protein
VPRAVGLDRRFIFVAVAGNVAALLWFLFVGDIRPFVLFSLVVVAGAFTWWRKQRQDSR